MKMIYTIVFLLLSMPIGLVGQSPDGDGLPCKVLPPDQDIPSVFSQPNATVEPQASAKTLASVPAACKYNTVAHRLLQIEALAFDLPQAKYTRMYAVLDSVIDRAVHAIEAIQTQGTIQPKVEIQTQEKIQPKGKIQPQEATTEREKARLILQAIDQSLWEMDFIVCIKTHFLHQALAKKKLPLPKTKLHYWAKEDARLQDSTLYYGASLNATAYPQVTLMSEEKMAEFLTDPKSAYHLIDCDLTAYIYLAVAEVLDLPIYLIEVPGHFFVRYEFSETDYLNWDNNTAKEYTDDEFRSGLSPSTSKSFSKEEEEERQYLQSLSREEATALHTSYIVGDRMIQSDPVLALEILEYAAEINPESHYAHPRISWEYNSYGYAKTMEGDHPASIPHFSKALELHPENGQANDNMGFALIQTGEPEKGKVYLEKATATGTNLKPYALRNWGAYYAATGKQRKAKRHYRKAMRRSKTDPVDLLELQYANLLMEKGRDRKANKYLGIAAERGESLAQRKLAELQGN